MHNGDWKHTEAGIILNYDGDDYSQGYGQIKDLFRRLTTVAILKPQKLDHDFRSSNVRVDDGDC